MNDDLRDHDGKEGNGNEERGRYNKSNEKSGIGVFVIDLKLNRNHLFPEEKQRG